MRAIVSVESRGYIYAINDNTNRATYCVPGAAIYPCNHDQAASLAEKAVRSGHSVDVGIAQVNSGNFKTYGVSAAQMLDPCENLQVGSSILTTAYLNSSVRFTDQRQALRHAIMAYNTGSLYSGASYVRAVLAVAIPARVILSVPSLEIFRPLASSKSYRTALGTRRERTQVPRRVASPLDPRRAPLVADEQAGLDGRGYARNSLEPAISR
jgi:type IV secretion system protein VirB1